MAIRLKTRTLKSTAYRALEAFLLLMMNVALSRALGPHDFGVVSYTLFMLSVIALITPMGFTTSALRFVPEYLEKYDYSRLKGFVSRSFEYTVLVSIVFSLLIYALAEAMFDEVEFYYSLVWTALLIPFAALMQLRRKVSEGSGQIVKSVTPDLLLPGVVIVYVMAIGVNGYKNAYVVIMAAFISAVCAGMFTIWLEIYRGRTQHRSGYENRHWLVTSMPMVAAGLGNVFMNRSDILVLGVYSEMDVVGRYAAAIRIVMLTVFVLNAVYVVVAPLLSRAYYNGEFSVFLGYVRKATVISIVGGCTVVLPLLVWPDRILSLFGREYSEARTVIEILALAQIVHVLLGIPSIALTLIGRQKLYAYSVLFAACVNFVGNIAVAPNFGDIGVAYVTLASTLLLKVIQSYFFYRVLVLERSSSNVNCRDSV
jgi:O-antigen/teichoic acid export membrane protein